MANARQSPAANPMIRPTAPNPAFASPSPRATETVSPSVNPIVTARYWRMAATMDMASHNSAICSTQKVAAPASAGSSCRIPKNRVVPAINATTLVSTSAPK